MLSLSEPSRTRRAECLPTAQPSPTRLCAPNLQDTPVPTDPFLLAPKGNTALCSPLSPISKNNNRTVYTPSYTVCPAHSDGRPKKRGCNRPAVAAGGDRGFADVVAALAKRGPRCRAGCLSCRYPAATSCPVGGRASRRAALSKRPYDPIPAISFRPVVMSLPASRSLVRWSTKRSETKGRI
jgi:hypothetical protein